MAVLSDPTLYTVAHDIDCCSLTHCLRVHAFYVHVVSHQVLTLAEVEASVGERVSSMVQETSSVIKQSFQGLLAKATTATASLGYLGAATSVVFTAAAVADISADTAVGDGNIVTVSLATESVAGAARVPMLSKPAVKVSTTYCSTCAHYCHKACVRMQRCWQECLLKLTLLCS
jgi:hypothetical protein